MIKDLVFYVRKEKRKEVNDMIMFNSWKKGDISGRPVGTGLKDKKSILANAFIVDDELKNKSANLLEFDDIEEILDIEYSDAAPGECKLDLLFKNEHKGKYVKDKFPILFNIHGGGWIAGDKAYRRGFCMQFAEAGFIVVNINYGLSPKYQHPELSKHVSYAMNWVYENADKYDMDIDNFFITGDSAGGHLSSLAVAIEHSKEFRDKLGIAEPKIKIKKVILHSAVLSFDNSIMFLPIMNQMIKSFTPMKRKKDLATYEYANYISFREYINENYPETLFVTSTHDFATRAQNKKVIKVFLDKGVKFRQLDNNAFLNRFHCFHLKIWMKGANIAIKESIRFLLETFIDDEKVLASIPTYKEHRKIIRLKRKYLVKKEMLLSLPNCPDRAEMINNLDKKYEKKQQSLEQKHNQKRAKYEKKRYKRLRCLNNEVIE